MTRYVGVDLHRRRSVIVVLDGDGTELWTHRIDNSPLNLGLEMEKAGPAPEVVLEATWGWYWAADVITAAGGRVHLAHPLGIAGYENRRVKNDQEDARLLADLLRMGRLPESWIPPESIRHQRELVRYRRKFLGTDHGRLGEPSQRWHIELGPEGVRSVAHRFNPGASVPSDLHAAIDLWIDEQGRLLGVRYELSGDSSIMGFSNFVLDQEFYDLGEPVDIPLPDADSVIALEDLAALNGAIDNAQAGWINAPGFYAAVRVQGEDGAILEVVRRIFEQRLASSTETEPTGRISEQSGLLLVWIPPGSAPGLIDDIVAPGEVSFRPVLDSHSVSPAIDDPEGNHPEGLDPETGLTAEDDITAEAYLAEMAPDGSILVAYHVGPAFLTGADIVGGEAIFAGSGGWVVDPEFTDEGGDRFREASKHLAGFAVGDPRRHLAIVVDGVVISAPRVAQEVDPAHGLDPSSVIITFGNSEDPEAEAVLLAAYLRYGALPDGIQVTTWQVETS